MFHPRIMKLIASSLLVLPARALIMFSTHHKAHSLRPGKYKIQKLANTRRFKVYARSGFAANAAFGLYLDRKRVFKVGFDQGFVVIVVIPSQSRWCSVKTRRKRFSRCVARVGVGVAIRRTRNTGRGTGFTNITITSREIGCVAVLPDQFIKFLFLKFENKFWFYKFHNTCSLRHGKWEICQSCQISLLNFNSWHWKTNLDFTNSIN